MSTLFNRLSKAEALYLEDRFKGMEKVSLDMVNILQTTINRLAEVSAQNTESLIRHEERIEQGLALQKELVSLVKENETFYKNTKGALEEKISKVAETQAEYTRTLNEKVKEEIGESIKALGTTIEAVDQKVDSLSKFKYIAIGFIGLLSFFAGQVDAGKFFKKEDRGTDFSSIYVFPKHLAPQDNGLPSYQGTEHPQQFIYKLPKQP